MKKEIWGLIGTVFVVLLIGITLYFEMFLDNAKQEQKPVIREMAHTELKSIEETEFSVTVQEVLNDSAQENEDAEWRYTVVEVENDFNPEDFLIVMEYSNAVVTPKAAICYTPDFAESYTAISINENMSGEIIFKPQTCKKGVWYLMLCEKESLGTYSVYGISESDYKAMKNPVILKPRDLDTPGALLPDE